MPAQAAARHATRPTPEAAGNPDEPTMPPPLDPAKRQAIVDAIRAGAGWRSRNSIAKEYGVAGSTVGVIAEQEGLTDAWDRTVTARASAAKQQDNRARRAELARLQLDDAFRIRERLWRPSITVTPTGAEVTTNLPTPRDVRDLQSAAKDAVKTHLELDAHDGDQGAEAAKSMLLGVADGLRKLYDASSMGDEQADEPRAGE